MSSDINDFLESKKLFRLLGFKNKGYETKAKDKKYKFLKEHRFENRQRIFSNFRGLYTQNSIMKIVSIYDFVLVSPFILYNRIMRLNCTPLTLVWFFYHQLNNFLNVYNSVYSEEKGRLLTAEFDPRDLLHRLNTETYSSKEQLNNYYISINRYMIMCFCSGFPEIADSHEDGIDEDEIIHDKYINFVSEKKKSKLKEKLSANKLLDLKVEKDFEHLKEGNILLSHDTKNILDNYHLFIEKNPRRILKSFNIFLSQLVEYYKAININVKFAEIVSKKNTEAGAEAGAQAGPEDVDIKQAINMIIDNTYGEILDDSFNNNPLNQDSVYYSLANMNDSTFSLYCKECSELIHTISYDQHQDVPQCLIKVNQPIHMHQVEEKSYKMDDDDDK